MTRKATSFMTSIQRRASLNSMASNMRMAPRIQHQVAQVQVAVALAHEAAAFAIFKRHPEFGERRFAPAFQSLQRGLVPGLDARTDLDEILPHRFEDVVRIAEGHVVAGHGDAAVEFGQLPGQQIDVWRTQLAAHQHPVEPRLLGELDHLDRVFDDLAAAGEHGRCRRTDDGNDFQVKRRRQPPVQAQFLFTEKAALFEGAEIEETQVDRLLDLVGTGRSAAPRKYGFRPAACPAPGGRNRQGGAMPGSGVAVRCPPRPSLLPSTGPARERRISATDYTRNFP